MKKVLLITINLTLAGLIIFLGFYYFNGRADNGPTDILSSGSLLSQFTSTIIEDPQVVRVSDSNVVSYAISLNGKEVLYLSQEGKLITSDLIGKEILSETQLTDNKALDALWSPATPEMILTTIKEGKLERALYNYLEDEKNSLNGRIQDISFSPKGNRVVYSFYDEKAYEGNISISNPDGSRYVNIFKTRMPDVTVYWPQESTIYFYKTPTGEQKIDMFSLDIETKKIENILKDKEGLEITWSPNGNHILFSESKGGSSQLIYMNMKTEEEEELNLETTADQCVWSPDNINVFCYKGNEFYKIDTIDESESSVFKFKAPNEISDLKITPSGSQLFFFNKEDGHLYTLILR